jgi:hypothetical protein
MGTAFVDSIAPLPNEKVPPGGYVLYSGTSFFPGVWQVNVQIPQAVDPSAPAAIFLSVNNIPSNGVSVTGATAVIYVKAGSQ